MASVSLNRRLILARPDTVSMLSVLSAVVWVVAAAAGIVGLRVTIARAAVLRVLMPVTVERLNVNVVRSQPRSSPRIATPPREPLPEPVVSPAIPPPALSSIADPKLNVPFPIAVKGPSKIVEARKAAPAQSAALAVEHLTFGQGQGDQPAPEYPREAKLAHQEGSVIVQMTINESGDVTDAKITSPSPWPILNQAALRAVRDTWRHFGKGPVRYKDIEFVFELHQR